MRSRYLLGLDVGTAVTKAVIFDISGNIISSGRREFDVLFPKENWAESSPEDIWRETAASVRDAISKANVQPNDIMGISVTNQRQTVTPVDRDGNAITNAISWQDRRALKEKQWMLGRIGRKESYEITGIIPHSLLDSASKLVWVKNNRPDVYSRAYKWLTVHDWIILKLTGAFATDWGNASMLMMFDLKKLKWSDSLLDAYELDADKLPETHSSGTIIGEVTDTAASLTGLARGTPVALGSGDQQCSALGVGIVRPGLLSMSTGTSLVIEVYAGNQPLFDPNMSCLTTCHALPGKYLLESGNGAGGMIYRWFRNNFGEAEIQVAKNLGIDPYQIIDEEAMKISPGSDGIIVYTYLEGGLFPYWTYLDRAVVLGLLAKHTKSHLARAILEGVAYKARHAIDQAEKTLGSEVSEVRHMGGGAHSAIWNQIYADVLGKRIAIPSVTESGALGAAMLAGLGVGMYKDLNSTAESLVKIDHVVTPDGKNQQVYDKLYTRFYMQMYDRIADQIHELSGTQLS